MYIYYNLEEIWDALANRKSIRDKYYESRKQIIEDKLGINSYAEYVNKHIQQIFERVTNYYSHIYSSSISEWLICIRVVSMLRKLLREGYIYIYIYIYIPRSTS